MEGNIQGGKKRRAGKMGPTYTHTQTQNGVTTKWPVMLRHSCPSESVSGGCGQAPERKGGQGEAMCVYVCVCWSYFRGIRIF